MPYFYYDSMLWVVLAVAVIGMIASSRVQSTFRKYSNMPARTGLRACDVAQRMLLYGGSNAQLTRVSGALTDHFNPRLAFRKRCLTNLPLRRSPLRRMRSAM